VSYYAAYPSAAELDVMAVVMRDERRRLGLGPELTLKECGDMFDLSRERIRQLEAQALKKLFKAAEAAGLDREAMRALFRREVAG
jgi:DNA-directed RNA polymerase sigma subunit (sigma70/sigma32)